jgi:hypothetical protein
MIEYITHCVRLCSLFYKNTLFMYLDLMKSTLVLGSILSILVTLLCLKNLSIIVGDPMSFIW